MLLFYIMSGSCGCGNQTNAGGSHFVCSEDYTHRRIAPMIVDNKVSYDNETFIATKVSIPKRSKNIGMIFNNKSYKLTSSHGIDTKKQMKFNHAENDKSSDNNVSTNIPLANFSIFNKSKMLYNNSKPTTSLNNSTYGKHFSQERHLMKKKKNNFICENTKFIC